MWVFHCLRTETRCGLQTPTCDRGLGNFLPNRLRRFEVTETLSESFTLSLRFSEDDRPRQTFAGYARSLFLADFPHHWQRQHFGPPFERWPLLHSLASIRRRE